MPPKKSNKSGAVAAPSSAATPKLPLSNVKLGLPVFLQMLNKSGGMSMTDAMAVTKKVFPTYNTPAALADLTAVHLIQLSVDNQDQRKMILTAIRKAGYVKPPAPPKTKLNVEKQDDLNQEEVEVRPNDAEGEAGPSSPTREVEKESPARKRKRQAEDLEKQSDGHPHLDPQSLEWYEELDEDKLRNKSTVINRAPVMTAWATIVAERLGFKRTEALSIASVYTEMNATSRGIAIGVFDESKNRDHVAGSTQPFVELMGRKIPVLETETGEWRGIVKGSPVDPKSSSGYLHRSFRQTLHWALGAMRLLANSFDDDTAELNKRGYDLYCDFRPENPGWGKKAEMRMEIILKLRRKASKEPIDEANETLDAAPEESDGHETRHEGEIDEGAVDQAEPNHPGDDVGLESGDIRETKRAKQE